MITIIDYKAGNLTSVKLAFEHIGVGVRITDRPEDILSAERVVFPGVGAAGTAMETLRGLGLIEPIRKVVASGVPFLGICIGMQLLFERSEEDGGIECVGLLSGEVKKFCPPDVMCKIPQMGWNEVKFASEHPLFEGIDDGSEFYFVHSYYPECKRAGDVLGKTDYADVVFSSAAGNGNLAATQFHPERSGRIGLKLLKNFSLWDGKC
ncbi:MAG: imidazole glycerol phosphate synthase subunit HisH [Anaerohalosphaeraceae bacterium]|nr:imidazole glycerol phosphate synthase subunit HisH [Anaerohalosphaeraceae bacterium]